MFDSKKIATIALVGFGLVAVGAQNACSSGSSCTYSKACPNDPDLTADQKTQFETACKQKEAEVSGQPCYSEAKAYGDCSKGAVTCGADGKTDAAATQSKILQSCINQLASATQCCQKNPTSKVCTSQ